MIETGPRRFRVCKPHTEGQHELCLATEMHSRAMYSRVSGCAMRRLTLASLLTLLMLMGCSKKPTTQVLTASADASATAAVDSASTPQDDTATNKQLSDAASTKAASDATPVDVLTSADAGAADATAVDGVSGDAQGAASAKTDGSTATDSKSAKPLSRDGLATAYIEIYCAQRRGKTRELYAIYERHGFAEPLAWRRAWDAAATDSQWVADLTKRALDACE